MAEIKKYTVTEPYLDIACGLGEAPFFDASRNELRFVDIVKCKLVCHWESASETPADAKSFALQHTLKLDQGPSSHKEWPLNFSIGITANIEDHDDEFIFGGKSGYGLFNRITGEHHIIKDHWSGEDRKDDGGGKPRAGRNKEERMRSNDGAVDSQGRFFVGTMNDQSLVASFTAEGVLFRLDPDLSLHRVKEEVTIPNGMSWSDDRRTMYVPSDTICHTNAYYWTTTGILPTRHPERSCHTRTMRLLARYPFQKAGCFSLVPSRAEFQMAIAWMKWVSPVSKTQSWVSYARILAAFAHDLQASSGLHATGQGKFFA